MGNRALIAVGAIAAAIAIAAATGLLLAAIEDGGSSSAQPAAPVVVEILDRPGHQAHRHSAAAARGPVPALAAKPARGPAFAIAHLRPGVRVALWTAPGRDRVEVLGPRTEFGSAVVLSVVKARTDWLGVTTADVPDGRLGWIRRDPKQVEVYWTKYSLHADLAARTLSLRYGSGRVARVPVTVGAPGSETPSGRFAITDALSFHESPFYGCCALALSGRQSNLPPGWIGGDRLAIHGTPGPVGGAESHGCIRATDATMRMLFRRIPLGTPVFIDG